MNTLGKKLSKSVSGLLALVIILVLSFAGTVMADMDLAGELANASSGDTVTLSEDVFVSDVTIPEGVTLVIPDGCTLEVSTNFENNGSLVINGVLQLPGEYYIDETDEWIPPYDIGNLTNCSGTGTVVIENVEYTYIEDTGRFGCLHTEHNAWAACINCGEYIVHEYDEEGMCQCGNEAGAKIVSIEGISYYDSVISAIVASNEILSEDDDAEIIIYVDGQKTFWSDDYLNCDMVLNNEIYMPGDGCLTIGEGAVVTITENGSLGGNVSNVWNCGTIIISEGTDIPGVTGKPGSCIIVGDVRYGYTEAGNYEICNHTSYVDGKCSGCGLVCAHDSYTMGSTVDCETCDISLDLNIQVSDCSYTGEKLNPTIKVLAGDVTLIDGTDYRVTWPDDMINAGDKTVTITGMGLYNGTATKSFAIIDASDDEGDEGDNKNTTSTDTGDTSNVVFIIMLMTLSGALAMIASGKYFTISKSN